MYARICRWIGLVLVAHAGAVTPLAGQAASGQGASPAIPGLAVQNLQLFATGSPIVARSEREYRSEFASETTALLGVELHLRYTTTSAEVALPVVCTFLRADGTVFRERSWTTTLQPGWSGSYSAGSTGAATPGYWQPGAYRVWCDVAGVKSHTVDFRVAGRAAAAPATGTAAAGGAVTAGAGLTDVALHRLVTAEYLRFFESGQALPPRAEREYGTSFAADRLRWLGIELHLRYPAPGRAVDLPINCTIRRADGSFSRQRNWLGSVQPTWSGHYSSTSVGLEASGPWEPGRYRVQCGVGAEPVVATAEFTLTGDARPVFQTISICVLDDGALRNVQAQYNPATGDTLMNGRSFRQAYPNDARYAAGAPWYVANEPITYQQRRYVKYGLPRILGVSDLSPLEPYRGVQLFSEAGVRTPDIIYVPVRSGCEFQPFSAER